MNKEEQLVYTLILGRTLEAFMPSCRVEYTTIDVVCAARKFSVQTYRVLKKGWLSIFGREHLIARGGYALFRTTRFLPGRAGTGKRMQYRPQENTSGIPLYG